MMWHIKPLGGGRFRVYRRKCVRWTWCDHFADHGEAMDRACEKARRAVRRQSDYKQTGRR